MVSSGQMEHSRVGSTAGDSDSVARKTIIPQIHVPICDLRGFVRIFAVLLSFFDGLRGSAVRSDDLLTYLML